MRTIETLEDACARAWPPLTEEKLGDWRLRAANGFSGRANSVLAVGTPGTPVATALGEACEFAHRNGIAPRVQAIHGSTVERELTAAGWRPDTEHAAGALVSVLLGPLPTGTSAGTTLLDTPNPGWWQLVTDTTEPSPAQRHVLTGGAEGHEMAYCAAHTDGELAGAARGALVDDLLYLSSLTVGREHRRRGLATRLMNRLGTWASARRATACVLQVAADNAAALAVYERLGFEESHRYRYWVLGHSWEDHVS